MAGPKQKTATKKTAAERRTPRRNQAPAVAVQKRAARDVSLGPPAKQIERSLNEGTKQTLDVFRSSINWTS